MLTRREKRWMGFLVGLFLFVFFLFGNIINAEASRRYPNLQNRMEASNIMTWPIEVNNKIFQVHVNRDDQSIIVSGVAENETEKTEVEERMRMRSPATYQILSEVVIVDTNSF